MIGISPEEKINIENRRKNEIKSFEEKIKNDMMLNIDGKNIPIYFNHLF